MRTKKVTRMNRLLLSAILAIATATISTLSAGLALAASASEIDRNATQALSLLYKTTPGQGLWPTSQRQYLFSRVSSRVDSSSRDNLAMGRYANEAGRLATIDR
jgi:ABC-type transporter MlaC component